MAFVELQQGESFESALRRFKRKVQMEAIIKEIKKHSVYLKPGERKRLKAAQAKKRMRKRMRRDISEL
ncbi:MAG TPA: 30S ribosomal protein S21 [Candidatus Aminicenantes bacterium]|nr:30S ribosomal protein S21 [Candidatus Aminicenantes bacterium]